ncbi:MAG: ABC transporter ATP-binding protein [Lachnospiraceae bacterium]
MSKEPVLSVEELAVNYPSTGAGIEAVSFRIARGEVLGLLGESGSGKSTVCNAILGLLDQSAVRIRGSIRLGDIEINSLSWHQREKINGKQIGIILQNPMASFNPYMKIKGHFVETLCTHLSCGRRDAVLLGLEALKLTGLKDEKRIMNSYPFQLSGGMLQRVMIAIAVSLNPVLLIADEPTTALDDSNQRIIMELLAKIMKEFCPAMLLVSHDLKVMEQLADRLIVLKDGQVRERGSTAGLLHNPADDYTRELLAAVRKLEVERCWK